MGYKLYKDSELIKKIFKGSESFKKIYKGSQLIWQADPYEPGSDVFYKTGPATYQTTLPQGVYDLIIAGGGGQADRWAYSGFWYYAKGGSGAVWEGTFYNPKDQPCKFYAGNTQEDSYFELNGVRLITAGKGEDGAGWVSGHGGYAGVINVNSSALQIVQQRKSQNGNKGAFGTSSGSSTTASVCSINSWGQGGANGLTGAIAGGVRLKYLRMDK